MTSAGKNLIELQNVDYFEQARLKLAKQLCLLLCSAFFIMTLIEIGGSLRNLITYFICSLFPLSMYWMLVKTKKYKLVYFLICLVGIAIAAFTLNLFTDEIHYGELMWMTLIVLLAFWGLGTKMGILFLFLSLLNLSVYFVFNAKTNLTSLKEINNMAILSLSVEVFIALSAITIIVIRFIKNYEHSFQKISIANQAMQETAEALRKKNEENETLLKEVHHRVKNNLQIIVSLLRLQNQSQNDAGKEAFEEAINRIMAMALIHKKLYQSEDLSEVNLESYLYELIEEIKKSQQSSADVEIIVKVNLPKAGLKTVVPLGLMINELIANSYKHAFKQTHKGKISIEITSLNHIDFEMIYSDSGNWEDENNNTKGFGLDLIDTLCHQMEGSFTRKKSMYNFKLKNLDIN